MPIRPVYSRITQQMGKLTKGAQLASLSAGTIDVITHRPHRMQPTALSRSNASYTIIGELSLRTESSQTIALEHPEHEELEEDKGNDGKLMEVEDKDVHDGHIERQRALSHE